ncbi:ORF2b protein [Simian hemorrhagic encephalitis virus]|uniref:ORF2b protein n=1 Tax=Simian hemorrhagic encephalitis virus TaxID=1965068 RepID=A0A0F6PS71_9NIDO|nr:ORF2b protein [Simian hemorrhagic encephalitis virus]AKC89294.1 ORF2b protein [Simian hemorrhagic encephalitis virus]
MVPSGLLHACLSCIILQCVCCSAHSNNSSTSEVSTPTCFSFPRANFSVHLHWEALVCKADGHNELLAGYQSASTGGCSSIYSGTGFALERKVLQYPHNITADFDLNNTLDQSHAHVSALLTAVLAYDPMAFGLDPNYTRSFNVTSNSTIYTFCVNGTVHLPNMTLGSYYFFNPSTWDLYILELFRPFVLSLLVLSIAFA